MSRIKGIDNRQYFKYRKIQREVSKKGNKNQTLCTKDDVEKKQIAELLYKLPKLDEIFNVHRKIGEGTFSSVYLASLKQHMQMADEEKRWFAVKHLVPTAHPSRIEHELKCLQDIGGKNYVIGVELCLRHLDTIVFIMPYIPHKKFSEYMAEMSVAELRDYMRALLTALQHVHSFGVIHRDIKPSNFLYDRLNKRYLLVDFGLAQRVPLQEMSPPPAHSNTTLKRPMEEGLYPAPKRVALDLSRQGAVARVDGAIWPTDSCHSTTTSQLQSVRAKVRGAGRASAECVRCGSVNAVCAACAAKPPARAPRAGTQGFRPPEVLLKYPHQTTAVDIWACGVVMLSVLSARYPFFRAADDVSSLCELADLLGTQPLQCAARALGRRILTSTQRRGLCLRKLCVRLRSARLSSSSVETPPAHCVPFSNSSGQNDPCIACNLPHKECLCKDHTKSEGSFTPGLVVAGFPDAAFSLVARLLEPEPSRRLTAAEALRHPFFEI